MFNFDTDKVMNPITGDKVSVSDSVDCTFRQLLALLAAYTWGYDYDYTVVCDYHYGIVAFATIP